MVDLQCTSRVPIYQTKPSVMAVLGCNGSRCAVKLILSVCLSLSMRYVCFVCTQLCIIHVPYLSVGTWDSTCRRLYVTSLARYIVS